MTQAGYFMLGVIVGIIINIRYVRRLRIRAEDWPKKVDTTKPKKLQRVVRVYSNDDLDYIPVGFTMWHSEYTKDPEVIGKIHEHLRNALEIRLYISKAYIEYTAITRTRGQVSGGCHRMGPYDFFEFGIRKLGHRFDIYGEDRKDPTIKAFFDWWVIWLRNTKQNSIKILIYDLGDLVYNRNSLNPIGYHYMGLCWD